MARGPAGLLAGGLEQGDVVDHLLLLLLRWRGALVPVPALPIAQPEDAGARIGRQMHLVGEGVFPALVQHRALDLVVVADRTLVEAARHPGIGDRAGLAHRRGERRMTGDPVVDGA